MNSYQPFEMNDQSYFFQPYQGAENQWSGFPTVLSSLPRKKFPFGITELQKTFPNWGFIPQNSALQNPYLNYANLVNPYGILNSYYDNKYPHLYSPLDCLARTQTLIQESKNANEKNASDYFNHTTNQLLGDKSCWQPMPTNDLGIANYSSHALYGHGQDFKTDIHNLKLSDKSLMDGLLNAQPIVTAVHEIYGKGKDNIPISIESIPFDTSDWQQMLTIGKVKLRVEGTVRKLPNYLEFNGLLDQGNNAEVFTFPKGHRSKWKEMLTADGKNLFPFTLFRTTITGQKPVKIRF